MPSLSILSLATLGVLAEADANRADHPAFEGRADGHG
jgi:hypothetical protein